jgi:hypothetical protein
MTIRAEKVGAVLPGEGRNRPLKRGEERKMQGEKNEKSPNYWGFSCFRIHAE